jgi:hypothetical protein
LNKRRKNNLVIIASDLNSDSEITFYERGCGCCECDAPPAKFSDKELEDSLAELMALCESIKVEMVRRKEVGPQ